MYIQFCIVLKLRRTLYSRYTLENSNCNFIQLFIKKGKEFDDPVCSARNSKLEIYSSVAQMFNQDILF